MGIATLKEIRDFEQFRYELRKDIMEGRLSLPRNLGDYEYCVNYYLQIYRSATGKHLPERDSEEMKWLSESSVQLMFDKWKLDENSAYCIWW